jgi:ABC-type phosphate transport system auxiliary subunit
MFDKLTDPLAIAQHLEAQRQQMDREISAASAQLGQTLQNQAMQRSLDNKQAAISDSLAHLNAAHLQMAEMKEELEALRKENHRLTFQVIQTTNELEREQQKNASLQSRLQDAENENAALVAENKKLNVDVLQWKNTYTLAVLTGDRIFHKYVPHVKYAPLYEHSLDKVITQVKNKNPGKRVDTFEHHLEIRDSLLPNLDTQFDTSISDITSQN